MTDPGSCDARTSSHTKGGDDPEHAESDAHRVRDRHERPTIRDPDVGSMTPSMTSSVLSDAHAATRTNMHVRDLRNMTRDSVINERNFGQKPYYNRLDVW